MGLNNKVTNQWTLIFSPKADREIGKLDKSVKKKILTFFDKVVDKPNPRIHGKPLRNKLNPFWSYRIGDYRVICRLDDEELVILAVKAGHRRDVYDFEP